MSSFRGRVDEAWSLARAVDSMRDAARAAGRPGLIWLAGVVYPALELGLAKSLKEDTGWLGMTDSGERALPWVLALLFGGGLAIAFVLPIYGRLMAGLVRVSPPRVWEQVAGPRGMPRLRTVWQAGRGLTLPAVGMWILLGVLQRGATLLVLGVAIVMTTLLNSAGGSAVGVLTLVLLAGPVIALVALYAVVISMLHQLALHSLAHNRRGVASALQHAWRIARNDPVATLRAVSVDLVLYASILLLGAGISSIFAIVGFGSGLGALLGVALAGFAGVTRAGYWARAYQALGGLSPDDGVPGLDAANSPAPIESDTAQ